jgi:hypothetical protein
MEWQPLGTFCVATQQDGAALVNNNENTSGNTMAATHNSAAGPQRGRSGAVGIVEEKRTEGNAHAVQQEQWPASKGTSKQQAGNNREQGGMEPGSRSGWPAQDSEEARLRSL